MNKLSIRDGYGIGLHEVGAETRVVVLDADLSCCTRTEAFVSSYPQRHFNLGIAEANMMGVAAGLASCGKKVFANSFAMFAAGRAFEQIRNSIAYPGFDVVVVGSHGGISVGEDGATHQCVEDLAIMRAIPGMTVICPADAQEARAAVHALMNWKRPAYLRLCRMAAEDVFSEMPKFQIGKATRLREGKDLTLIACGILVPECLKAAEILNAHGLSARVVNMPTVKPLDEEELMAAACQSKLILTAEEHNILGGLGSAVAEFLCEKKPLKIIRVGVNDRFGKSGDAKELMKEYGLDAESIAARAIKAFD